MKTAPDLPARPAFRSAGFSMEQPKWKVFDRCSAPCSSPWRMPAGTMSLERAYETITRAIDCGGVDDPYARSALQALVRSCKTKAVA